MAELIKKGIEKGIFVTDKERFLQNRLHAKIIRILKTDTSGRTKSED